jgi:hypothetical protein
MVIMLIVVVLVLVLHAARDPKLERFKFRFYGSLPGKFGIEVESQRESVKPAPGDEPAERPLSPEPARLPPGPESAELPPGDAG